MDGWSNMFVRLINFSLHPIRGDRKIRRSFANNIYPPLTKRKEREKRRIQFPSILLSFHEKLWSFFRLSSLWTFHRTYVTSLSTNVRILNRRTQTCTKKTRRNNIKKKGAKRDIFPQDGGWNLFFREKREILSRSIGSSSTPNGGREKFFSRNHAMVNKNAVVTRIVANRVTPLLHFTW